jgi:hypothetical protein
MEHSFASSIKLFPHFVPTQTDGITKADMPESPVKIGDSRGRIQCKQIWGGF